MDIMPIMESVFQSQHVDRMNTLMEETVHASIQTISEINMENVFWEKLVEKMNILILIMNVSV